MPHMNRVAYQAWLDGISCAQAGGLLSHAPLQGEHEFWIRGFRAINPDPETQIEDVFVVPFGGPPILQNDLTGTPNPGIGAAHKPENYLNDGVPDEYNQTYFEHFLESGYYDVTGMTFLRIEGEDITAAGLEFVNQHGATNIYLATSYDTQILFVGKPKMLLDMSHKGVQILEAPKSLLIVEPEC